MYEFAPLEQPPGPDATTVNELEALANQDVGAVPGALDTSGSALAAVLGLLDGATSDVAAVGADLAAAADILASMSAEEDAIDLAADVGQALAWDDLIQGL